MDKCSEWKLREGHEIQMLTGHKMKQTLILLLIATFARANVQFCVVHEDTSIQQLEDKLKTSDVVFAGYTRHEHSLEAEFLVLNVFKGDEKVSNLFKNRKLSALESALNRRLVNVTGFATVAPDQCEHVIRVGETYLLFARFLASRLILHGKDAIQSYSKTKEEDVKKVILKISTVKSSGSEWSTCSKSCGGGIQIKRSSCPAGLQRNCADLQRSCNTFPCIGLTDVLKIVGLRQSMHHHPEDRPTAYRLSSNTSWKGVAPLPTGGFPTQFSLMIAIRSKSEPVHGFLFRLLQDELHMQVAVHLSKEDTVSLILPGGLYVRFKQQNKLKHGSWQWMSFSIRRNTVTFFLDCKPSGVLPAVIEEDSQDMEGPVDYIVGSVGDKDRSAFQGDVEQILFAEAPSAAAEQCSVLEQPATSTLNSPPTSEFVDVVPSRRKTSVAPTKQDDEDFAFNNDEDGSGSFYDDEYEEEEDDVKKKP